MQINRDTGALAIFFYSFVVFAKIFFRAIFGSLLILLVMTLFIVAISLPLLLFPAVLRNIIGYPIIFLSLIFLISWIFNFVILLVIEREQNLSFFDFLANSIKAAPKMAFLFLFHLFAITGTFLLLLAVFFSLQKIIPIFLFLILSPFLAILAVIFYVIIFQISYLATFITVVEESGIFDSISTASEYFRQNWGRMIWKQIFLIIALAALLITSFGILYYSFSGYKSFIAFVLMSLTILMIMPFSFVYHILVYESVRELNVFFEANRGEKIFYSLIFIVGFFVTAIYAASYEDTKTFDRKFTHQDFEIENLIKK